MQHITKPSPKESRTRAGDLRPDTLPKFDHDGKELLWKICPYCGCQQAGDHNCHYPDDCDRRPHIEPLVGSEPCGPHINLGRPVELQFKPLERS